MFRHLVLSTLVALSLSLPLAAEEKPQDTLHAIGWDALPDYIQNQVNHVVLTCTEGTLTPSKVKAWRYESPDFPETFHYLLDFSPWKNHPVTPTCSYGPRVCEEAGCLMIAYSQLDDKSFKLSLRLGTDKLIVTDMEEDGLVIPMVELVQSPYQCRAFNQQAEKCKIRFTWHGGTFRFFGFGKAAKVFDPSESKYVDEDGTLKPTDAMGNPLPNPEPPPAP